MNSSGRFMKNWNLKPKKKLNDKNTASGYPAILVRIPRK
jgi:hypothetical protein